ncbi:MAG: TonB C-terminal domain-containing protein [Kofleriaceae bacterium]
MRRDRDMHLVAAFGTVFLTGALIATPMVWAGSAPVEEGPSLADMEAIEASLAYKKAEPPKQPKKRFRAPDPIKKEGVSRDDTKKPEVKKEDPKPKDPPQDLDEAFRKLQQRRGEDDPIGKPSEEEIGAFDGSQFGFAEESRGDPYFQKLVADLVSGWEYPEILQESGQPVGCMRLTKEGKVQDTLFKQKSDNGDLNDSVERALAAVKKLRNENPQPVPTHLLKAAITQWVCFKFRVKQ